MPPPEPVLETIVAAAAARLQAMEQGDTYWATPVRVLREFIFPDHLNEFPVFCVELSQEESGEATLIEIGDGLIEAALGLEVTAYGLGREDLPVLTVLARLLRDAEVALTTPDMHLGLTSDLVLDILNTRRVGVQDVDGFPDRRGALSHLYRVRYNYLRGQP